MFLRKFFKDFAGKGKITRILVAICLSLAVLTTPLSVEAQGYQVEMLKEQVAHQIAALQAGVLIRKNSKGHVRGAGSALVVKHVEGKHIIIVTAKHVAMKADKKFLKEVNEIRKSAGKKRQKKPLKLYLTGQGFNDYQDHYRMVAVNYLPHEDLAVMVSTGKALTSGPEAQFSSISAYPGMPLVAFGAHLGNPIVRPRFGHVTMSPHRHRTNLDSSAFHSDVWAVPGMSGGPVFNQHTGHIVGVLVAIQIVVAVRTKLFSHSFIVPKEKIIDLITNTPACLAARGPECLQK